MASAVVRIAAGCLKRACAVVAATAQLITMAAPPPLPADSLYFEVVEARLRQGLHFRRGGQTVRFGDSPQVRGLSLPETKPNSLPKLRSMRAPEIQTRNQILTKCLLWAGYLVRAGPSLGHLGEKNGHNANSHEAGSCDGG